MKKPAQINSWFDNGCPYQEGVALYAAHGTDAGLKVLLPMGETRYNARKLYTALKELQQRQQLVQEQKAVIAQEKAEIAKEKKLATDPRLAALYPERNRLHAQLSVLPGKSDRKRVAFKILSLTDKIERIIGVLPEEPQKEYTLPTNPLNLLKLRNNNRSYISKERNKKNNPGEVQRRMDENSEIEKLLNNE